MRVKGGAEVTVGPALAPSPIPPRQYPGSYRPSGGLHINPRHHRGKRDLQIICSSRSALLTSMAFFGPVRDCHTPCCPRAIRPSSSKAGKRTRIRSARYWWSYTPSQPAAPQALQEIITSCADPEPAFCTIVDRTQNGICNVAHVDIEKDDVARYNGVCTR